MRYDVNDRYMVGCLKQSDLDYLINAKYIQLSNTPLIPNKDELIKHKVEGGKIIETKQGYILILDLINLDTDDKYTYSYSDIINFEYESETKIYISCLNRKIIVTNKDKEVNLNKASQHVDLSLFDETDIYRILIKK
jgi:hypothetical protein